MRELIFRGKTKADGRWIISDSIAQYPDGDVHLYDEVTHTEPEVDPETVGQYTGVTDKNGKNIFEGDIIKGSWNTILVVFYDDISTSYRVKTLSGSEREISYYNGNGNHLEIIGNIHDNGDLL